MIDPTYSMFNHIRSTPEIVGKFGKYLDLPAMFEETAPDGFEITDPIIIVDPPHNAARDDTSTCVGRAYDMNLRVYARVKTKNGATGYAALNAAAEALARALHNSQPDIDGARTSRVAVNGPSNAPTDNPAIGGRLVALRWNITET